MNKSTEQTPKTAETQSRRGKGKKTAQAIALAVLTVIGAEQTTSPQIAFAGLQHAQQETAKETQRIQERHKLIIRQGEILDTINNIIIALKELDVKSSKAKDLFNQLYQMQVELMAVCTGLGTFTDGDKRTIAGIDEIFNVVKFTPDKKAPKIFVCDATGCRI